MRRKKALKALAVVLMLLILAGGVGFGIWYGRQETVPGGSASGTAAEDVPVVVPAAAEADQIRIELKQDGSQVSGKGALVQGNQVRITEGGTYRLSGSLSEGQVYVETGSQDQVVLILDNVEISNATEAAIHIENADRTYIVLEDGTENFLKSGQTVTIQTESGQTAQDASGGALYSRDDLTITGGGALTVYGYINNGIHTTNDLVIQDGLITVEAVNHGVKGKDSVTISGGEFHILAGSDGIQSDDTSEAEHGVILITGGTFEIESGHDAIQAETVLEVRDGDFTVRTGGGSADVVFPADNGWGRPGSSWDMQEESEESCKGLKSGIQLTISGGSFTIDSRDDAFHTNGSLLVGGGSFTVSTGDDGFHADEELTWEQGEAEILSSYEGLEAVTVLIAGGNLNIRAADDGINANGGQAGFGRGMFFANEEDLPLLHFTGGNVVVNADGDGIDSNGSIVVDDGWILINGPVYSGNAAIDSGRESGGSCLVNGGTVLALGSAGMAESFDEESGQYSFRYDFPSDFQPGDVISIADSAGNQLFCQEAVKAASSVIFSSPDLKEGETYLLTAGELSDQILLAGKSTVSGSGSGSGWGRQFPGRGQPGTGEDGQTGLPGRGKGGRFQPPDAGQEGQNQPPEPGQEGSLQPPEPGQEGQNQPPEPPGQEADTDE